MKVQVEELSPIERKLSIEVDGAKVAEELDRAYAVLNRQVKIAGFRPGKIPRRILESRFKQEVEGDVVRRVVERAYLDAVRQEKLEPVSDPQVTNGALRPNEPFAFQARVEVKPKVEARDYKGLPLKKSEVKVEDSEVGEQLEKLRERFTRLEPIQDRDMARKGDYAVVDYEATVDGKEFPGSKAEAVPVEIAPGEVIDSRIPALEGVKVGETKEIDYAFPPDYGVEQVQGKTGHFKLHLKALKAQIKPELNDDFAKEVQGGQTLDELKAKVRSELEKSKRLKAESEEREGVIKELIARNAFEVPRGMVDRTIDGMLESALRSMARSGIDPRTLNLDFNRLREELREKAVAEVKGALILEAIARKEGLQPSDEDVEKKLEQLAADSQQALSQVRKHFKDPSQRGGLLHRLLEEKTIEFLKANATYS